MNFPIGRPFRLVARGEAGPSCDEDGLSLGGIALIRRDASEGRRRCEGRPLGELSEILGLAYGKQPPDVVARCHRGLGRVAARLEGGDLALASMEAVMIGLPDLTPAAMSKLANLADFEKAGTAWQMEPRIPAGQPGGGQWTTGDGGATPDGEGYGAPPAMRPDAAPPAPPPPPSDVGVYHPVFDRPVLIPTAGAEDVPEDSRHGIGGNRYVPR